MLTFFYQRKNILQGGLFFLLLFFFLPIIGEGETAVLPKSDIRTNAKNEVTLLELNDEIKAKKNKIADVRRKIAAYEKNIKARQSEKVSLENELENIDESLLSTSLDIEATQDEIEQVSLEIEQANFQIEEYGRQIEEMKERLAEFVRRVYDTAQRDTLELLLSNSNFEDFFDEVKYVEQVNIELHESLSRVKTLHQQLSSEKNSLELKKQRQAELKRQLEIKKEQLDEKKGVKKQLITQSILSAGKYQQLLNSARAEQFEVDAAIGELERSVRQRLKLGTGAVNLAWPVDPGRGITTQFNDPSYPFRHLFEHGAIDIRASQGTYVRASEAGYVGRTRFDGKKYAYIMILHDNSLATVYGHLSRIIVPQDSYVQKGQVIGLSGGAPGSDGAGPLTTGAHLHFEVRLNGIPVDPLRYLP